MRVAVLMPAFDEGQRLGTTLAELGAAGQGSGIVAFVIDDGSVTPVTPDDVRVPGMRVVLARHRVNLGQGAAIETARRLALSQAEPFDVYVTMDADGQHGARDVLALAGAITAGADVALGDRFAGGSDVPASRRVLLRLARVFERLATGLRLSDAHNGLRAFGPRAIAEMRIRQNRMAHATEITQSLSRSTLHIVEVPVSVRYTRETMRKGQRASGALAIVVDLFHGFLFGEGR